MQTAVEFNRSSINLDVNDDYRRPRMSEPRQSPRTRIRRAARVIYDRDRPPIDCIVDNISIKGACIFVCSLVPLPDELEFSLDRFQTVRQCDVKWRAGQMLGLEFK